MPPAARITDLVLQSAPHCHAPIHPPALVPTPVPHPALPLQIIPPGGVTVLIGGLPAARVTDMTLPCMLPGCIPAGPGVIVQATPGLEQYAYKKFAEAFEVIPTILAENAGYDVRAWTRRRGNHAANARCSRGLWALPPGWQPRCCTLSGWQPRCCTRCRL